MTESNKPVRTELSFKDSQDELIRLVNRANATNYADLPPEIVEQAEVGTYTVGFMDKCKMELLSVEPECHFELIDSIGGSFGEATFIHEYITEHVRGTDRAVIFNLELDTPISTGDKVVYMAAFASATFTPAVISQLERKPAIYIIIGLTEESVSKVYTDEAFTALAAEA